MAETVGEIFTLIRDVSQQRAIPNTTLTDYLNSFYQNQFHLDIGMKTITKMWNFQTLANTDEYAVSERYRLITSDDVQLNSQCIELYTDRITFDSVYTDAYVAEESLDTGDAVTTNFTGTLDNFPVVPKSMVVSDDVETFKDVDGAGVLTGSLGGTGTIVYSTGVYNITFNTAPADGQDIYAIYAEYTAAQPSAVLYYNNVLKFRPIPDKTYDINIQVAERPTALTISSILPDVLWGDALAYGTAMDILNRYGNEADALYAERQYKKKLSLILAHQYKISTKTRTSTPRW